MSAPTLDLDRFMPYRLSITSNAVSEVISRAYEQLFGLKIPEWRLLAVIAEGDGISQQDIGKRTRMDKVTVSRAAIAMQTRGLIKQKPNERDGRSHLLILTDSGYALYQQVVPKALAFEAQLFDHLTAEEIQSFSSTLSKIADAAEAALRAKSA
jgi:DNA-binding MarR family transcriptional regulator